MAKRGRKAKDPWALVPTDYQATVRSEKDEKKLRDMIAQAQLDREALDAAKKLDGDYQEAKERLKTASATYREGDKALRKKIQFVRAELGSRGKDDSEYGLEEARQDVAKAQGQAT